MDKQKQIEEMANAMFEYALSIDGFSPEIKYAIQSVATKQAIRMALRGYATALINAGYRKIPENAVVLTREELDKKLEPFRLEIISLSQELIETSQKLMKARKETAEKFAQKSKQRLSGKLHRGKALHTTVFGKEYVRRIFKEVIDEVCKEITEGK